MEELVTYLNKALASIETPVAVLIGVVLATLGWLYSARRQRTVMRKQHTFDALLRTTFNKGYQDALTAVREYILAGKFPDRGTDEFKEIAPHCRFLLNHYEVLAAGIRSGDISEKLLKDTERFTIQRLFETAEASSYITSVRDERKRRVIFEHVEWLYERWHEMPPPWWQTLIEVAWARPLYHHYYRWVIIGVVAALLFAAILLYAAVLLIGVPASV